MDKIKANIYIISEDGSFLTKDAIDIILQTLSSHFEPANAPEMNHMLMEAAYKNGQHVLNAHNEPKYLLGEIEESDVPVIVVAWYENEEGMPRPKFFVSAEEIERLVKALISDKYTDSWEAAIQVKKEMAAENNQN